MLKRIICSAVFLFLLFHNYTYNMQQEVPFVQAIDLGRFKGLNKAQLLSIASLLYEQAYFCESLKGALYAHKLSNGLSTKGFLANDIEALIQDVKCNVDRYKAHLVSSDWDALLPKEREDKIFNVTVFYVLERFSCYVLNPMIHDLRLDRRLPEAKALKELLELIKVFCEKIDDCTDDEAENCMCSKLRNKLENVCATYSQLSDKAQLTYCQIIEILRAGQKKSKELHLNNKYFDRRMPLCMTIEKPVFAQPKPVISKKNLSVQVKQESIDVLVRKIEGTSKNQTNQKKDKQPVQKKIEDWQQKPFRFAPHAS